MTTLNKAIEAARKVAEKSDCDINCGHRFQCYVCDLRDEVKNIPAKPMSEEEIKDLLWPVIQNSVLSTHTEANDTADNIIRALRDKGCLYVEER